MANEAGVLRLTAKAETWVLRRPFTIARGTRTEARTVTVSLSDGTHEGRGECVPYRRYGETVESVLAALATTARDLQHLTRATLAEHLPPGAARNAIDCAWWDLEAKQTGRRVWDLASLPPPGPVLSAFTISLDTPDAMAAATADAAARPLLKVKLDASRSDERLRAVRAAAPDAHLIVDANEAFRTEDVVPFLAICAAAGVALVEQPLPAGADEVLAQIDHPFPICADESCHTADDVAVLADRYDMVNVKLDKAGGFSEAMRTMQAAHAHALGTMVGCMISTSLAIAPALLLAQGATYADVDAPLWLARDRVPPVRFDLSTAHPAEPALWG